MIGLFMQAAASTPLPEGGLPWPIVAVVATAGVSAIGVQYWENRKKDAQIVKLTEDAWSRDLAAREKDLAARSESTRAIERTADAIADVASAVRDQGARIQGLATVQDNTTRSLIDALAKKGSSSQTIAAVRPAEGSGKP